jgi:hypothetical protein
MDGLRLCVLELVLFRDFITMRTIGLACGFLSLDMSR